MSEKVFTIWADSSPAVEVVITHDGVGVTIRDANNHDDSFEFPSSMIGALIKEIRQELTKLGTLQVHTTKKRRAATWFTTVPTASLRCLSR